MRPIVLLLALVTLVPAATAAAQDGAPVVRIPIGRDDGSLTPYTFRDAYPLVTLVYDTLTWRDAGGRPRPWLARSIRRSPDRLTVTVRLRRGVRWHDGRPFDARDVAFTYGFVARREHPRFTPQVRDIASATAAGAHTVVFRLHRPSLGLLDQPFADVPILPRHLWDGLSPERLAPPGPPVGTGPYRLTAHEPGTRYVFTAVRNHFRGRPAVERIDVPVERRRADVLDALSAGRADMVELSPDPTPLRAPTVRTVSGESYAGTALLFNLSAPPFDRLAARRAVARSLDLERVARGAAGTGPLDAIHPADRGYVHPASRWAAPSPLHRDDPDAARVAFAEQGIGSFAVLASASDPVALEAAREVVLAVNRAGGRARVEERGAAAMARATGQDGAPPEFQAAVVGTAPLASYDPAFLDPLFRSDSPLNLARYRSAEFDRRADAIADARTATERRRAATAALEQLARELPVVPLLYPDVGFAYRPGAYDGWRFIRGSGILDKRSFLARGPAAGPRRSPALADPLDRSADDPSGFPLTLGAAGLLALGLALAALRRRGRSQLGSSRR